VSSTPQIFDKKHLKILYQAPTDRHMMHDLTPLNHSVTTGTTKIYNDSEHEESNSIYHEPYRVMLQRGTNYRNRLAYLYQPRSLLLGKPQHVT